MTVIMRLVFIALMYLTFSSAGAMWPKASFILGWFGGAITACSIWAHTILIDLSREKNDGTD